MSEQVPSDDLFAATDRLTKECAEHLTISIQCATRCSTQAAQGIVISIEMYVDALIQRERARQVRS